MARVATWTKDPWSEMKLGKTLKFISALEFASFNIESDEEM